MFEKVNPSHPDKIADRIAGAIVDIAYKVSDNPSIAVEVLIGHGKCNVIIETDVTIKRSDVDKIVKRIAGDVYLDLLVVPQDSHLNDNQKGKIRCGDNGIFKGSPLSDEEKSLSQLVRALYTHYPYDGKFIIANNELTACQSNFNDKSHELFSGFDKVTLNPLGEWTGGTDVDTGATNRKLGSDMARGVTGGGIHGKDLSKADVSVNIYAFLESQKIGKEIELHCSIGDEYVNGVPYGDIVETARLFVNELGGFEKLAEWGLV